MKKIFNNIHLWLSLPFGLIITIICLTGAMLVFENEFMELCYPKRYFTDKAGEKQVQISELMQRVCSQLPDTTKVSSIQIYSDTTRNHRVVLDGSKRIYLYIDPYSGEIKDSCSSENSFSTILRLHRWLLDKPKKALSNGKIIIGVSTIAFLFVLISGIIIWIPKTRQQLKNRLSIKFKLSWKRFFYDLHVAGGIYISIILIMLAVTGLTWSFSWYRTHFYKLLGAEVSMSSNHHEKSSDEEEVESNNYIAWNKVYDELKNSNVDYKYITIQNDGSATLLISNIIGNSRATNNYTFDPLSGDIKTTKLYENKDKASRIRGWVYSIHVGSWSGIFSKIITFLAAILGASLPLTGYYLWIKRTFLNKKKV